MSFKPLIIVSLSLLTLLFVWPASLYSQAEPDSASAEILINDTSYKFKDSIIETPFLSEESHFLDMLDSLVAVKFFGNTLLDSDTAELNVYSFPADSVPVYPDSIYRSRIERLNAQTPIELTFNKTVKNFIHLYAVKKRELTSRILGLSEVYFPLFEEELDRQNMPLELKYLAVVESALNPTANSRAGAKGLWQFMFRTGRAYDLKVTSLVDDRFDPHKSTHAACRHLKDLYEIYGDWSLAMAAYNSGAGNVNKAIRRAGGVRSYWAVWPFLPRETRGYVPAFIAVTYVMNHAAEHNLYPLDPGILYDGIDTVIVNDVLSLDQVSEMLEISRDQLEFLNPSFKEGIIPVTEDKKYVLSLPRERVADFIDNESDIYAYKTKKGIERDKLLEEIKKASERNIHYVRYGENLGLIAQKYRTSVRRLMAWNGLRSTRIYPGQKLVIYGPNAGYASSSGGSRSKSPEGGYHIVRRGDNLGAIAQKYGVSIRDIKQWNNLSGNTIHPNQKLLVGEAAKAEKKELVVEKGDGNYVYYTVKRGDTLWDIAKEFEGVSISQIKKLNNISNSKKLKPGQKIKIELSGESKS